MKIKRITLENYQQFRNFTLDLTYPEGHPKAGQPLDKICFIGQSGTGKTTLLKTCYTLAKTVVHIRELRENKYINYGKYQIEVSGKTHKLEPLEPLTFNSLILSENILIDGTPHIMVASAKEHGMDTSITTSTSKYYYDIGDSIANTKKVAIYFSAELLGNEKVLEKKLQKSLFQTEKEIIDAENLKKERLETIEKQKLIQFVNVFRSLTWEYLLQDIEEFDSQIKEKSTTLLQKAKNTSNVNKLLKELQQWQVKNPNPRKELAEKCLNPILEKFQLQMDTENADGLIKIKHKDGSPIPNRGLSTGTKQVILTALPLYKFDTKDTVILFDEPERSLFPDIQQELVDYYVSLAPEAQFFFATHSPMIASSFEPYERFILTFDEEGYVTSKSCWRGDAPKGADPNDILVEDFKLRSYRNEFGRERWEEYVTLQEKIRQTTDEKERKALLKRFRELGDAYKFDI